MGFDDILTPFSPTRYAAKLTHLPLSELQEREVAKTKHVYSACAKIGGGVGLAAFTQGISLASTALGARQLYVAERKLELLRREVERRGVECYEARKRDMAVPIMMAVAVAGAKVGVREVRRRGRERGEARAREGVGVEWRRDDESEGRRGVGAGRRG